MINARLHLSKQIYCPNERGQLSLKNDLYLCPINDTAMTITYIYCINIISRW